jgi:hypothetical protein
LLSSFIHIPSQAEAAAETKKKEDRPKSPSFLSKLLGSIKDTKTKVAAKAPKSPKKDKKKEEAEVIGCLSLVWFRTHSISTGGSRCRICQG